MISSLWAAHCCGFNLSHFWQKFRESNVFTKEITKELIWRNIFLETKFQYALCTMWKSRQKHDNRSLFLRTIPTFFPSNQLKIRSSKLLKSWFHENFWAISHFMVLFHTALMWHDLFFREKVSFTVFCYFSLSKFPHILTWGKVWNDKLL